MDIKPEHQSISIYMDDLRKNQQVNFEQFSSDTSNLLAIEQSMKIIANNSMESSHICRLFYHDVHTAYLHAISSLLGSNITVLHSLLRFCFESAAYALFTKDNPERGLIWMRRMHNNDDKKILRKIFQDKRIKRHLLLINSDFADEFTNIHEMLIDYGAHPSIYGVAFNKTDVILSGGESSDKISHFVNGADIIKIGINNALKVGYWCLYAGLILFPHNIISVSTVPNLPDNFQDTLEKCILSAEQLEPLRIYIGKLSLLSLKMQLNFNKDEDIFSPYDWDTFLYNLFNKIESQSQNHYRIFKFLLSTYNDKSISDKYIRDTIGGYCEKSDIRNICRMHKEIIDANDKLDSRRHDVDIALDLFCSAFKDGGHDAKIIQAGHGKAIYVYAPDLTELGHIYIYDNEYPILLNSLGNSVKDMPYWYFSIQKVMDL